MTDNRDFAELLQRLDRRIRFLTQRWWFDDDIGAEAALSLWQHVVDGVSDDRELCRRMDLDVRRYARSETRQRSIPDRLRSLAALNDTAARLGSRDRPPRCRARVSAAGRATAGRRLGRPRHAPRLEPDHGCGAHGRTALEPRGEQACRAEHGRPLIEHCSGDDQSCTTGRTGDGGSVHEICSRRSRA